MLFVKPKFSLVLISSNTDNICSFVNGLMFNITNLDCNDSITFC